MGATACAGTKVPNVQPLPHAHAHNDYEHPHPLLDALERGFCSVEADVHLVDGELFVAHDANAIKPDRTLRKLYLEPLLDRVRAHGGRAYEGARDLHDASRGDLIALISDNWNLHFRWRGEFDRAGAAARVATDRLTRDR